MTFEVIFTRRASNDIAFFYEQMADRSVVTAEQWRTRLYASTDDLEFLPERFPLAPESEWYGGELRELLIGKRRNIWRVLYVVRGSQVAVMRVRHGRQDLLKPGDL